MAKENIVKGSSFFLSDCGILRDKLCASILCFFLLCFPGNGDKVKAQWEEDCTTKEQGGSAHSYLK